MNAEGRQQQKLFCWRRWRFECGVDCVRCVCERVESFYNKCQVQHSEMPPRRSLVSRSKVFPGASPLKRAAALGIALNEPNPDQDRSGKQRSLASRLVNKVIWLGSLWQKVNGNVFAYLCFLTIFSIVVRNTQGGDDKMYLMVQTIIGQVEGGFDSTDHTVYPVTGKKNFGIRDIGNLDDMWEWLNPGQFTGIFFPESWCAHMRSAQQMHDHSLTHLKVRRRRN